MLICLFIAIFATILWLNITVSDCINAKINPYSKDNGEEDNKRVKVKTYVSVIAALFWAIIIRYLN